MPQRKTVKGSEFTAYIVGDAAKFQGMGPFRQARRESCIVDSMISGVPIGIENFEELRTEGFYYVDKTGLIADLLKRRSKVTLITRPRRFGKTLNMSMLKSFFSMDGDKSIFDGLKIAEEKRLCEEYMGKYPVISISLKEINASGYDTAAAMAVSLVREAAQKHEDILLNSIKLSASDKEDFLCLLDRKMPEEELFKSFKTLSRLLEKHYGQKVIILIDEYDVPLAKAFDQGYYDRMVILIRNLFENTLKTNDSLKMAVLTGCMRISKESIFTGLNNLRVLGISDTRLDEYFGFTDGEVRAMLEYCGAADKYEAVRQWYDGYLFGGVNVYCPWDVINFCDKFLDDPDAEPKSYWMNSSGNSIVRKLIEYSGNATVQGELERLVNGGTVYKNIRQDLTYGEMYASIDNIWSVLYTTGYLTQAERSDDGRIGLTVPNLEVRMIFAEQIIALFRENMQKDSGRMLRLCDAFREGDTAAIESGLNDYLSRTISIRDSAVRTALKENFYHGLLLGILGAKDSWMVESNREAGDGYFDIRVWDIRGGFAMIIELKYADDESLNMACQNALKQIEEKRYADDLHSEEYDRILKYGIAFCRKKSKVMLEA